MGWEQVWTLALVQFGAEDIELRILTGLGVAFVLLMIVEGLRASFRPARRDTYSAPARLPEPKPAAKPAPKTAPSQPVRARMVGIRTNPKRIKPAVNRHRALRPIIRRGKSAGNIPSFTEEAVPYTPLPPKVLR